MPDSFSDSVAPLPGSLTDPGESEDKVYGDDVHFYKIFYGCPIRMMIFTTYDCSRMGGQERDLLHFSLSGPPLGHLRLPCQRHCQTGFLDLCH